MNTQNKQAVNPQQGQQGQQLGYSISGSDYCQYCECGIQCKVAQCGNASSSNYGRTYTACNNPNPAMRCGYFKWINNSQTSPPMNASACNTNPMRGVPRINRGRGNSFRYPRFDPFSSTPNTTPMSSSTANTTMTESYGGGNRQSSSSFYSTDEPALSTSESGMPRQQLRQPDFSTVTDTTTESKSDVEPTEERLEERLVQKGERLRASSEEFKNACERLRVTLEEDRKANSDFANKLVSDFKRLIHGAIQRGEVFEKTGPTKRKHETLGGSGVIPLSEKKKPRIMTAAEMLKRERRLRELEEECSQRMTEDEISDTDEEDTERNSHSQEQSRKKRVEFAEKIESQLESVGHNSDDFPDFEVKERETKEKPKLKESTSTNNVQTETKK